jgi:eukaryotic-like serine/threonine-protein kinase
LETQRIDQPAEPLRTPGAGGQLASGTTVAKRYLVQDVIGVGGMGSVYRARDLHFPNVTKLVAVKEMINQAPDPLVRQTIVQNFEREANILATLAHPSIPRIYDYFSQENRSYLVLEFVNGKDLETIINETQGFLSEQQVIAWAIELCDVLAFLHAHQPDPIIFRDMKPSNVMINQHNRVVLVDFGIAKPFQTGQKGTMIGTEGYSPPEQYRGEASIAADIYALGATIHHALTRRDPRIEPPFSFAERPIRKINPAVSAELEAVLATALQYNPSDRFKNVPEMKEALMNAARRTGMLVPTSPTMNLMNDGIKPIWAFKCEDELRGSPTVFEQVVYAGCYDNNLYAINAANGEFLWKYPTDGSIAGRPAIYEGNLFIGSEDNSLHVVSTRTGKVVWTYQTGGRIFSSPRVADGHVFVGSDDHSLHAVNINTGRAVWKFECAAEVRSSAFVINEKVYIGCESGDFYCIGFRGDMKWRFKAKRNITSSPLVQESVVYFTSVDGMLYALDKDTGFLLWKFRMEKGSISSPMIADNNIFFGAADNHLYAVDIRTTKEAWRFRTDHQVVGAPILYKDALYFGSADGFLYCLEARTGRLRWKFETKGPITSTPVAFDDMLYLTSTDHFVYALLA